MEFTTGLMSLDTALNEMLSRVTPLTAQETLPLVQCFGRILASDVVSPLDVPGFDNSAMDGYAVRLADPPCCAASRRMRWRWRTPVALPPLRLAAGGRSARFPAAVSSPPC